MCNIIIPEGRQVCPACEITEREGSLLTNKDKLNVTLVQIKSISKTLHESYNLLKQAEEDWVKASHRETVSKHPVFSTIEGQIKVEIAIEHIENIKRMIES